MCMSVGKLCIPALSMLLATGPLAAEIYKWVDENGLIHYGDHVPAKYADQTKEILNSQGIRVGTIEGRKTPEELAAEALRRQEEEAKRQRREQDRILLETYLSVEEIVMLRDRRLELIEAQTRVTEAYLGQLQNKLSKLENEATAYNYPKKAGSELPSLPTQLGEEIKATTRSIIDNEEQLTQRKAVHSRIKSKFDQDIERFGELKGL